MTPDASRRDQSRRSCLFCVLPVRDGNSARSRRAYYSIFGAICARASGAGARQRGGGQTMFAYMPLGALRNLCLPRIESIHVT